MEYQFKLGDRVCLMGDIRHRGTIVLIEQSDSRVGIKVEWGARYSGWYYPDEITLLPLLDLMVEELARTEECGPV